MRHTHGGLPIPDWAIPYVGGLMGLVALIMLVVAVQWAMRAHAMPRKRWGNAAGLSGAAVFAANFAVLIVFEPDMMPWPMAIGITAFVVTGVGGTLAGWQRR